MARARLLGMRCGTTWPGPFPLGEPAYKRSSVAASSSRLAPSRIAGFGLVIGRIKAGQLHTFLTLAEPPFFIGFVFAPLVGDNLDQILRNYPPPIIIHDDHVIGKHGATAAADRLLPTDKCEAVDGCRGRNAGTPHRK